MNSADGLKSGVTIRTHAELGDTMGMLIAQRHIEARRPSATGVIAGYVPGHGGDVWWVRHNDNEPAAAYCYTEFDRVRIGYPGIASGADCPEVPEMSGRALIIDFSGITGLCDTDNVKVVVLSSGLLSASEWWAGREQMARVCWRAAVDGKLCRTAGAFTIPVALEVAGLYDWYRGLFGVRHWLELDSPPLPPEWTTGGNNG